jgi:hypothetical protein
MRGDVTPRAGHHEEAVERFETRGAQFDALRARRLQHARVAGGLSIAEAARRLEMSFIGYALLESGQTELVRPESWDEAERILSAPGTPR